MYPFPFSFCHQWTTHHHFHDLKECCLIIVKWWALLSVIMKRKGVTLLVITSITLQKPRSLQVILTVDCCRPFYQSSIRRQKSSYKLITGKSEIFTVERWGKNCANVLHRYQENYMFRYISTVWHSLFRRIKQTNQPHTCWTVEHDMMMGLCLFLLHMYVYRWKSIWVFLLTHFVKMKVKLMLTMRANVSFSYIKVLDKIHQVIILSPFYSFWITTAFK